MGVKTKNDDGSEKCQIFTFSHSTNFLYYRLKKSLSNLRNGSSWNSTHHLGGIMKVNGKQKWKWYKSVDLERSIRKKVQCVFVKRRKLGIKTDKSEYKQTKTFIRTNNKAEEVLGFYLRCNQKCIPYWSGYSQTDRPPLGKS